MLTPQDKQTIKELVIAGVVDGIQEVVMPVLDQMNNEIKQLVKSHEEINQSQNINNGRLSQIDRKLDITNSQISKHEQRIAVLESNLINT